MLYQWLYPLRDIWFGFNVFKYITFRVAMASVTSFALTVLLGPYIIRKLKSMKINQRIRRDHVEDLYQMHKHKENTPTMGGILIICGVLFSTLLWARMDNVFVLLCLVSIVWLGLVGYIDDYLKIIKGKSDGLRASAKFIGQLLIAVLVAVFLYFNQQVDKALYLPFFKNIVINMGIFYILFVVLIIVGTSNAVNITDGLDGLAAGCIIIVALTYAILSYITGNAQISSYLNVYYLPGAGELAVLCAAIAGAGLGFLWHNCHPADIFMGDTGSLPLGGVIGVVCVIVKKELLLLIVGGIFVVEVLSVIMQIVSCKLRNKKLFLIAPLHHHFQYKKIPESKIIIRFWIVAIILALISLSTLKLR